jgi:hypothetical protein
LGGLLNNRIKARKYLLINLLLGKPFVINFAIGIKISTKSRFYNKGYFVKVINNYRRLNKVISYIDYLINSMK